MNQFLKIGFLGCGNLAQSIIKGMVEQKVVPAERIYATNRSEGKLTKTAELYGIKTMSNNDDLVDTVDVVILAMKPQDLPAALENLNGIFHDNQLVISLAAGVTLKTLKKKLPKYRVVRLMPNTPAIISRGVLGYVLSEENPATESLVEDLFSPLGYVLKVEDEDQFATLTVSCASGTGFVFELMLYWQEWIEEHGFEPMVARRMAVETFLGAAMLAANSQGTPLEDLLSKVTSKKGITAAGLQSMRELEIERALRYSFEKAALRNQELSME